MDDASATLGLLDRPDGSASYSVNGYSVLAAVNGPVEVQRRDEKPDEATIDVSIRPASGVAGIRERYFESIVLDLLRRAVRTSAYPRTLIQVTLQVTETPSDSSGFQKLSQTSLNLTILPALLNAALLALLAASVPMLTMFVAAAVVVDDRDELIFDMTLRQINAAKSTHVFCFGAEGSLLLYLSEGPFSIKNLSIIEGAAKTACLGAGDGDGDGDGDEASDMVVDGSNPKDRGQLGLLRQTVLQRLAQHDSWRST